MLYRFKPWGYFDLFYFANFKRGEWNSNPQLHTGQIIVLRCLNPISSCNLNSTGMQHRQTVFRVNYKGREQWNFLRQVFFNEQLVSVTKQCCVTVQCGNLFLFIIKSLNSRMVWLRLQNQLLFIWEWKCYLLSRVWLFATPWTKALQTLPFMEFSGE